MRSFPGSDRKIQISTEGGGQPRWRRDGKELYFIGGDGKLMAAPIRSGETLEPGVPVPLFQTPIPAPSAGGTGNASDYAVNPDGTKFLFVLPETQSTAIPITVIQNWVASLKR